MTRLCIEKVGFHWHLIWAEPYSLSFVFDSAEELLTYLDHRFAPVYGPSPLVGAFRTYRTLSTFNKIFSTPQQEPNPYYTLFNASKARLK